MCESCAGLCCRYLALPIETPEDADDFDDVRWYLAHEGISVFVEDNEWYIQIATRCKYLQKDHRCAIYPRRPKICRSYTDESCDYHSGDYGYDLHFGSLEELDEYLAAHGKARSAKEWDRMNKKDAT